MKKIFVFLLISCFLQTITAQNETELITQALTDYIEGSTNGQPDRLKKVFHPDLNLYSVGKDKKLVTWTGTSYIEDTKEGKPTGEYGKILSIDYVNDAAVAKVKISHPKSPSPYVDYFMLLKLKEGWTIIHKMYIKESRPTDLTEQSTSEIALISAALMDYIEGTAKGEANRVERAFHKDLNLYTADTGELKPRSGQKYIKIFEDGRKRNRVGSIVSIDYENGAAIAKVKIDMPDSKKMYTDYMLLLKLEGSWKIIHKSYTFEKY